jgi:two-component system response regulator AtoC
VRVRSATKLDATAICDGTIHVKDLPERIQNYSRSRAEELLPRIENGTLEEWVPLSAVEGRYVAKVLGHTRGNKQAAARLLEVDRKTLDRMIKRHNIHLNVASFPSRAA